MPPPSDDEPRVYEIILSERAESEIDDAYFAMIKTTSPDFAWRWRAGIHWAIQNLSMFPESNPVAESESRLYRREVRRLLFKQRRVAYHVFFAVIDADLDGIDDMVRILHVKHASQE